MTDNANILVGITGGIAAYKVANVVSALAQNGHTVTVCMTDAATRFVAPLTFEALSGRRVITSAWEQVEAHDSQHVALARATDVALVAPATMDTLARLATGRADDAVTLILAAIDRATTPVLLAPSMNATMWSQPATRRNVATLRDDGFRFIGPDDGWQACRTSGAGRMAEPDAILSAIETLRRDPTATLD